MGGQSWPPVFRVTENRFHLVFANDARIGRSLDLSVALKAFESDLHLYVAAAAHRRVSSIQESLAGVEKLFSYSVEPSRIRPHWY